MLEGFNHKGMSLRECQTLFKDIYIERDLRRGAEKTLLWLVSEMGELSDAFVKGDVVGIKSEIADVIAWLLSFCNVIGVDAESCLLEKYGKGCPKCNSVPCKCFKENL